MTTQQTAVPVETDRERGSREFAKALGKTAVTVDARNSPLPNDPIFFGRAAPLSEAQRAEIERGRQQFAAAFGKTP